MRSLRTLAFLFTLSMVACDGTPTETETTPTPKGTVTLFDLNADLTVSFFDMPMPSDLRVTDKGAPDYTGFPNPNSLSLIEGIRHVAMDRKGFPTVPVAYFRFTSPMPSLDPESVVAADKTSPFLLVDVDPDSNERGRLFPTVALNLEVDNYTAENMIGVAARPGFVLKPNRKYAFVVQRSLNDAEGKKLDVADELEALAAGKTPEGALGSKATTIYQPLWETLDTIGVARTDVAAATVFTTGDVVQSTFEISEAVKKNFSVEITDLAIDPDDGIAHERFCELKGKVVYPQFQTGTPPFDTDGLILLDDSGVPIKQRDEEAPIAIAIPKMPMPAGGYPMVIYFHGSGGLSDQFIDRGKIYTPDGTPEKGKGPAHELAYHGFASAGSALPVNPERLPGAAETEYLNLNNLAAMRDTFRQGVIEQRLFLEALRKLKLTPDMLAGCTGVSLPAGETEYYFSDKDLFAQGQSMGGMYTNMIGSTEPRIRAVVPTGAGGFWTYFITKTSLIPDVASKIGVLLLQTMVPLTFLHPAMHISQTALEPADPMVYMPRLGRRPLSGHPVRPIYEPVGKGDSYFPTVLYDAIVLAYGHPMVGDEVWPTMQPALELDGLDGILSYPVENNKASELDETPYTGAVVQYEGDGIYDPHGIYGQLDEVKYQYGCFFATFLKTGKAKILAPKPLGSPCE
ncbi:MAG: hypothetical protein IPK82_43740 [Polyangiaceae bacterium]|nr:hypothetical protein [Polyangiaceae bacterium]